MTPPLVSICIPTRNGERYLEEALRSAFAQTYPRLEIVISDDGSSDGTLGIIDRMRHEAPMPVTVGHHQPSGIGANWNHCVRHAKGAYIKFLFQDDLITPDCVQRMMDLALTDERVGLVYCRRRIIVDGMSEAGRAWMERYGTLHGSWKELAVQQGVMDGRRYLADRYLMEQPYNKIGEPTAVLIKKECFGRDGWFDARLEQSLDYIFWYQVMRHYKVGFVDAELAMFRLHAGQATQRNARSKALSDARLRNGLYLERYGEYLHPDVRRTLLNELGWAQRSLIQVRGMFRRIFA